MQAFLFKVLCFLLIFTGISNAANAQDSNFRSKHAAILFPYPMYKEKWRASIGYTLLTLPEDITEEIRLRLPSGDLHVLRKINTNLILDMRLSFQFLQNHLSTGIYYVLPVTNKIYISAGDDIAYWFGFLKMEGFNTKGHGILNYPSVSIGYKTNKNLLISLKASTSINLYYKSSVGTESISNKSIFYNGENLTLAVEQPFYGRKHLTLAFSAINNYFNWQTWALFYKTDRKIFYPQITVGFIL